MDTSLTLLPHIPQSTKRFALSVAAGAALARPMRGLMMAMNTSNRTLDVLSGLFQVWRQGWFLEIGIVYALVYHGPWNTTFLDTKRVKKPEVIDRVRGQGAVLNYTPD